MPSYSLRTAHYPLHNEADRAKIVKLIVELTLGNPLTVTIEGERNQRSIRQNKTQRMWIKEIAQQLGDQSEEEVRGYCKLTIGVPILRAENDEFRERYDKIVRPLPYDQKLALMMEPFDMPVTRIMTTKQHAKYLDEIQRHFAEQGVILTQPGG